MKNFLFSPTASEILALLIDNPDKSYYLNELVKLTGRYPNSVSQALKTLFKLGLLEKEKMSGSWFYKIDRSHKYFVEVQSILVKGGYVKGGDGEERLLEFLSQDFEARQEGDAVICLSKDGKTRLCLVSEREEEKGIAGRFSFQSEE